MLPALRSIGVPERRGRARAAPTCSCKPAPTASRATRTAATARATTSPTWPTAQSGRSWTATRRTPPCPASASRLTAARSPTSTMTRRRSATAGPASSTSPPQSGAIPAKTASGWQLPGGRPPNSTRSPSGAYVNTLSDEGAPGLRRAYPDAKRARLTAIKDAYDPDNVFHLNHNIAPTGAEPKLGRRPLPSHEARGKAAVPCSDH